LEELWRCCCFEAIEWYDVDTVDSIHLIPKPDVIQYSCIGDAIG
jgi:hypothetical protein